MLRLWNKPLYLHIDGRRTQPQGINTALDALLEHAGARPTELAVTVSNEHAHFDVITGDYAAYGAQQLQSIALGCVTELLGDAAADQVVRWQLQFDQRHLVLCTLDNQLVVRIVEAANARQLRLASLQPIFCSCWNRHISALHRGSGVFAMAQDAHAVVCHTLQGSITALTYGSMPQPANEAGALDTKTNRLLSSIGHSAEDIDHYLLITRESETFAPNTRWTVIHFPESAS